MILAIVLPHAFLEVLGYILGAIGGGLISSDIELDPGEKRKDQFKKTYWKMAMWVLIIAIVIIILGALVETFVLENVSIYAKIIQQSYMI